MPKNRRPSSRDDGCCSMNFLKYVLFIFNFFFYLSGICILAVGIWAYFFQSEYVVLLPTDTYQITIYVLIGAGVLVFLVGIIGCLGVLKENRCCILAFTFLLLVVFLVEAVAGVLAYIYSEQIDLQLKQNLNNTIASKIDFNSDVGVALKSLHINHKCCGAINFLDWRHSQWYADVNDGDNAEIRGVLLVPEFCCRSRTEYCGKRDHPSNIFYDGCVDALAIWVKERETIIAAVALGISALKICGVMLSCCLYVKLKDVDDLKGRRSSKSYYR